MCGTATWSFIPCRVEFVSGNITYIYILFSFSTLVLDILPQGKGLVYPALTTPWLLMNWQCKEPWHQQPLHWPSPPETFRLQDHNGWIPLWHYFMMMSSNGNIFRVTGHLCREFTGRRWIFPAQRPVTQSDQVFFDLRLNKPLNKQSCGWWFETPSRSSWRHCNVTDKTYGWHMRWSQWRHQWRYHPGNQDLVWR